MSKMHAARRLLLLATIALSTPAFAAHARLGFTVAVETDGFFSTTLKQVKITGVAPGAPAEQAGLRAGDDVESVNDVPIVGTSGSRITDIVNAVQPGEHLRLKVLRGGVRQLIDIVGAAPQ